MARGALRGAGAAWLGLIVLQAVTTNRGADATGGVLNWTASVVRRALSPDVPALPDFSKGEGKAGKTSPVVDGGAGVDPSKPSLPTDAVIPRPSTVPIPGHPTPS